MVASLMLDNALARLDGALGQLEAAARRRIEAERGRGNLETELALMQDDRARLAAELDGAMARLGVWSGEGRQYDLHQPDFVLDERALEMGVKVFTNVVFASGR